MEYYKGSLMNKRGVYAGNRNTNRSKPAGKRMRTEHEDSQDSFDFKYRSATN